MKKQEERGNIMAADRNYAVLIDADNISDKYIKIILDEISNDGIATYKRIYGDWTQPTMAGWKNILLSYSVTPMQQYGYTTGKNATDSAMIIDAMDILYSGKVEGFCLVSSDSDFTRLASRLRESGMDVVGMGEKKTPKPFIAACNRFRYLDILARAEQENKREAKAKQEEVHKQEEEQKELLVKPEIFVEEKPALEYCVPGTEREFLASDQREERAGSRVKNKNGGKAKTSVKTDEKVEGKSRVRSKRGAFYMDDESEETPVILQEDRLSTEELDEKAAITTLDTIRQSVLTIVRENSDDDGYVFIGDIGNRLNKRYPDFDVRNYGFKKLTPFIQSLGVFDIKGVKAKDSNNKLVYVKEK